MVSDNHHTREMVQHQDDALDDNRTQHVRLLFAIHRLEACLGQAAPGREEAWQQEVQQALQLLSVAMRESQDCVSSDGGLVESIRFEKPFLAGRIASLQAEFEDLRGQIQSTRKRLAESVLEFDFADMRQQIAGILTALRQHQAKEADLVYEAINVDLGVGD